MAFLKTAEADALIAMPKRRAEHGPLGFPYQGGLLVVPLASEDQRERFRIDVNRGRTDAKKCTFQLRARENIVLLRLDIAGPSHQNPDGVVVPCPHMHRYREAFAERWAQPVRAGTFTNLADLEQSCREFMTYCNVNVVPNFTPGLLS